MNMEHLSGCTHRFEVFTAVVSQAEVQALSGYRQLDHISVAFELIADCGADEISTVRVEPLPHHQVDLAEVDISQIYRDFLGVAYLRPQLMHIINHLFSIHIPSI